MTARAALPVHLRAGSWRLVRELAHAAWPEEACGLLLRAGAIDRPLHAVACRNIASDRQHSYTIDPETYLRHEQQLRPLHGTVAGVWHSHPHGDPRPSPRDLADAWPNWIYLIIGVGTGGITSGRAWQLIRGEFVERVLALPHQCRPISTGGHNDRA